ncbi:MAG: GntR family transcriptional regulator [Thermodesulfobacteriota bacterium]
MARRLGFKALSAVETPTVSSLVDYAMNYVAQAIVSGKLAPGQQIKEEELAAKLGISRPPLREALKALEMEGLVVRRPRKGVFVSEIREQDIWEIYTLKMALYGLATSLAMERIKPRDLRKLEVTVSRMEQCLESRPTDVARYQSYHEEFHGLLMDIAGNDRLKRIARSLHNQVKRFSFRSLAHDEHLRNSCARHRQILQAIRDGNASEAEALSKRHVLEALDFLHRIIPSRASVPKEEMVPPGADGRVKMKWESESIDGGTADGIS